ncbi:hypothetical protein [Acaricomes phytoseiuli]|uniref:hypothetical protein n=1 Tax=Acaricomes phytoseiuli TaxID=291968 RepID=UPI00035FA9BD|nr:hypothetical protein [Acaricomes phytoseiuli]
MSNGYVTIDYSSLARLVDISSNHLGTFAAELGGVFHGRSLVIDPILKSIAELCAVDPVLPARALIEYIAGFRLNQRQKNHIPFSVETFLDNIDYTYIAALNPALNIEALKTSLEDLVSETYNQHTTDEP